jgi:hypothetical protein
LKQWRAQAALLDDILPKFGFTIRSGDTLPSDACAVLKQLYKLDTAAAVATVAGAVPCFESSANPELQQPCAAASSAAAAAVACMRYHDQDALNLLCFSVGGWVELEHTWNVQVRLRGCNAGLPVHRLFAAFFIINVLASCCRCAAAAASSSAHA